VSDEAAERLSWPLDFRIEPPSQGDGWFSVDGVEQFRQIGSNVAGGAFVLLPRAQRVLYVSSEGQAGIIAADFEEFIQLIVACPYWRDVLKYSANGNPHEMRRAAAALEATLGDEDEVNEARDVVRSQLGLAEPVDSVGALHRAVAASDAIVRAPDGNPCVGLLGRFTVDDTPFLRGIVD
jgi:hypothetical protein